MCDLHRAHVEHMLAETLATSVRALRSSLQLLTRQSTKLGLQTVQRFIVQDNGLFSFLSVESAPSDVPVTRVVTGCHSCYMLCNATQAESCENCRTFCSVYLQFGCQRPQAAILIRNLQRKMAGQRTHLAAAMLLVS